MPSALSLRTDYSPADLRRFAKKIHRYQPEPTPSITRCRAGRHEPDRRRLHTWDGSANPSRLGLSFQ